MKNSRTNFSIYFLLWLFAAVGAQALCFLAGVDIAVLAIIEIVILLFYLFAVIAEMRYRQEEAKVDKMFGDLETFQFNRNSDSSTNKHSLT